MIDEQPGVKLNQPRLVLTKYITHKVRPVDTRCVISGQLVVISLPKDYWILFNVLL